jgi:hypothetical protein
MNIYFDVDQTILSYRYTLRPGTVELFARLVDEGHRVHVWSGVGLRHRVVTDHGLDPYVSGVFVKPRSAFATALRDLGIDAYPEFVIDDDPEIVRVFGGVHITEYYFPADDDAQMQIVHEIISDVTATGRSSHGQWRAGVLERPGAQ